MADVPVATHRRVQSWRWRPVLAWVTQGAFALALLGVLILLVDREELLRAVKDASAWLLLATVVPTYASEWVRAERWRYLLEPTARFPTRRLFGVLMVGLGASTVLPLRAGDVFRLQYFGRRGLRRGTVLATLAAERLLDGLTFLIFLGIFAAYSLNTSVLPLLGVAALAMVAAFWLALRLTGIKGERVRGLRVLPRGLREPAREQIVTFASGLAPLRDTRLLAAALTTSLCAWGLAVLVYAMVGSAVGLGLAFPDYFAVVGVANLALAIPLTQAGLGAFELSVTGFLVAMGASQGDAAAYSLILHAGLALPLVAGGAIAAAVMHVNHRDVFFLRGNGVPGTGNREPRSLAGLFVGLRGGLGGDEGRGGGGESSLPAVERVLCADAKEERDEE